MFNYLDRPCTPCGAEVQQSCYPDCLGSSEQGERDEPSCDGCGQYQSDLETQGIDWDGDNGLCTQKLCQGFYVDFLADPCNNCGADAGDICRPDCIGWAKYYEVDTLSD